MGGLRTFCCQPDAVLLLPSETANWRPGDWVGCILYDPQSVALIEAMTCYIGNGSPQREARRKLLFRDIKQRSTNALTLSVWRDEKLIENAVLG